MEIICSELCSGCLSKDRQMKLLSNLLTDEEFSKIITEIPMDPELKFLLHICWECEAHISKYIRFKQQIANSYRILEDYIKKPISVTDTHQEQITSFSKLSKTYPEIFDSKIKMSENPQSPYNPRIEVKVEIDSYSDDDRTLFDIITEEKYKENQQDIDDNKEIFKENKLNHISQKIVQKETNSWQKKEEDIHKEEPDLKEDLKKKNKLLKRETRRLKKGERKRTSKKVKVKQKTDDLDFIEFEQIHLTEEAIIKDRCDLASKEEYANSMFKCEHCIMPFGNEEDLKEHVQKKHSLVTKHKCATCTRSFPNAATLERHSARHAARWRCSVCAHLATSTAAALAHYRRAHEQPIGEIHDLAAKAYGNYEEKSQENSEIRPKSTDQIPCSHCPKTFRWRTSLRKHMETHNIESGQKRRPHCEPCNMTFTTTSNLKKHMQCSSKHQIQLKLRKLKQDPHDSGPSPPDIENIKSSINSQKEHFPCPQCDKKFQWKGNLWRHLQSHAARANGALACVPCNRSFSSIATYKQHMEISRKHVTESEYKYMCSECGKRFYNKIKLRDHIDWEHLKKYTHVCSTCQKVFKSHTSLYLHRQVVHRLNNADHLCDHCGKSFPNKTKLRSHVSALHTRDTPYKCITCAARFSWHSCLSRHVRRVHRGRGAATSTS